MVISDTTASWIEKNPDVCGGEACIRRTRIMVWILVYMQRRGSTDAELLIDYPGLTEDDLAAVWKHYRLHSNEIERDIWMNVVAANHPPGVAVPPWSIVSARMLGLSDEEIAAAFDPPLTQTDLDAAWEHYRRNPQEIDREIAYHRLAA